MMHHTPTKTELRRGLVEQVRRPRLVMQALSAEELHALRIDRADDAPRLGLHDSAGPLRD